MSIDLLDCPVCYQKYDLSLQLPRILPTCGHTLCNTCLETLLRFPGQLKCPLDKKTQPVQPRTVHAFHQNYALIDVIEERNRPRLCPEHHPHELEFVCMDEMMKLCNECKLFYHNRNHDIQPISAFSGKMSENVRTLEVMLKDLESQKKDARERLVCRKASFLKTSREKFEQLALLLKIKEKELELSIEAVFRREEERIETILGDGAKIRNEILEKIKRCQDLITAPDMSRLISGDHGDITEEIKQIDLQTKLDGMDSALDDGYRKFQDSLKLAAEHLKGLKFESEFTCKMIDQVYQTFHQEFDKNLDLLWRVPIKSEAFSLEFCTESALKAPTILQIKEKAAGNSRLSVPFEIASSKYISSIFLKLSQSQISKLTSEDIKTLFYVRNILPNLESFHFLTFAKIQMPFETFKDLFSAILWEPSCFLNIDLDQIKNIASIGNKEISYLSEKFFRKAVNLKKIALGLENLRIGPKSLQGLLQSIIPLANNLEQLTLRLDGINVPEEILCEIMVQMDNMKVFWLSVDDTRFGDRAITKLVTNVFSSMPDIEEIILSLDGTPVTGNSVQYLLSELPISLRNFQFSLNRNLLIRDESIEYFVRYKLEEMRDLRDFSFHVNQTSVSPYLQQEIEEKEDAVR